MHQFCIQKSDCPIQKHQKVLLALARCQSATNESLPPSQPSAHSLWPEPMLLAITPEKTERAMPWIKMSRFLHYSRTHDFLLRRWELLGAPLVSAVQCSSLPAANPQLGAASGAAAQGNGEAGGISLVLLPTSSTLCEAVDKLKIQSELQSHHK